MTGDILALGPLLILGAVLLHAATRGMCAPCILVLKGIEFSLIQFKCASLIGLLHLRIQNTGSGRGPTHAHLLTADQEAGAPMRSDTADPHQERGLSLLADEVVL